jgi:hypothetical protein
LGDLERAIDLAAELGNAPRNPVWVRPKRTLRDMLSTMVGTTMVDAVVNRLEERIVSRYDFRV